MQRIGNLLRASFSAKMVSSGYTFLSSQILKILSIDLETDGSLKKKSILGFLYPHTVISPDSRTDNNVNNYVFKSKL